MSFAKVMDAVNDFSNVVRSLRWRCSLKAVLSFVKKVGLRDGVSSVACNVTKVYAGDIAKEVWPRARPPTKLQRATEVVRECFRLGVACYNARDSGRLSSGLVVFA